MLTRLFAATLAIFIFVFLPSCVHQAGRFENQLYIDPGNITDSLLPVTLRDDTGKLERFEKLLKNGGFDSIAISEYFDFLFRYRDTALLPLYYRVVTAASTHPYFKTAAIYAIGESGDSKDFEKLLTLWKTEKNELVREYLASAFGKLADRSTIPVLTGIVKRERNAYVRKTLEAAIRRASGERRAKIAYLPMFDTTSFRRIKTFPSESPQVEFSLTARKKLDASIMQHIPAANDRVFPHMQYKMCRSIYEKVNQPFSSFALPGVDHVGEDSGWLFEGMPVHSIHDGSVVLIQHEESWGCLVCIESILPVSGPKSISGQLYAEPVCIYYGHLSANLDVFIGKLVQKGDKIGEIGPSFSFENGGYRAHLHVGVEKSSIKKALIAGYHEDIGHWYSPVDFVEQRSGGVNRIP